MSLPSYYIYSTLSILPRPAFFDLSTAICHGLSITSAAFKIVAGKATAAYSPEEEK